MTDGELKEKGVKQRDQLFNLPRPLLAALGGTAILLGGVFLPGPAALMRAIAAFGAFSAFVGAGFANGGDRSIGTGRTHGR